MGNPKCFHLFFILYAFLKLHYVFSFNIQFNKLIFKKTKVTWQILSSRAADSELTTFPHIILVDMASPHCLHWSYVFSKLISAVLCPLQWFSVRFVHDYFWSGLKTFTCKIILTLEPLNSSRWGSYVAVDFCKHCFGTACCTQTSLHINCKVILTECTSSPLSINLPFLIL